MKKTCSHCGHTIASYVHNLNKPMVDSLLQVVVFFLENKRPAKLQKDLDLSKNQYNNFQKLQYFCLVKRTENGWTPEQKGIDFIYGKSPCFNIVMTFGKSVLSPDHEFWQERQSRPREVYSYEIDERLYKKREEYQNEMRQESLFGFEM